MLEENNQTFAESENGSAHESHTSELLAGAAATLVTLVVVYLTFFEGAILF